MAVKELVTDQEKLVQSKLWKVLDNQDIVTSLLNDLEDTLNSLPDRLFICSNEIGYLERAIMFKFADGTQIFINPAFQKKNKPILYREKDIITKEEYFVPRFTETELVYQDCLGRAQAIKLNEAASIVLCQAMDALNGLYSHDYGLPILEGFDDLTDEEKSEVLATYVNSLKERYNQLDDELMSDEDTKKVWEGAKFIKGVSDGTVKLEDLPMSNREKKRIKKAAEKLKQQAKKLRFWDKGEK